MRISTGYTHTHTHTHSTQVRPDETLRAIAANSAPSTKDVLTDLSNRKVLVQARG